MPSKSASQHRLMAMVANDPAAAKRLGISQKVGKEFMEADKGRKFGSGGMSKAESQSINKPKTHHGKSALFAKGGDMKESKGMMKKEVSFMKAKGAPKSMIKHEEAEMAGMKRGGGVKKMAMGGDTTGMGANKQRKGMTMEKMGSVKTAAPSRDGVAVKGKTKGTMVKMAGSAKGMKRGGKC
jgi:hypothetical protein